MKSNLKDNWQPKWLKNKPEAWKQPQPSYDPSDTNHQRAVKQKAARVHRLEAQRKAKKEAANGNV